MLRFVLTPTLCSLSFLTRKYKFIYILDKFVIRYFFDLVFSREFKEKTVLNAKEQRRLGYHKHFL